MDSSTTDLGGVLWLIIDVVAVAALGAAIAYRRMDVATSS
jgi:hypothetical protein